MTDIEKIRAYFEKDRFAMDMGIRIESAADGVCTCSLPITPALYNAGDTVQGGAIFTLADFAFAVAANCGGMHTVSHSSSVTFIKAGIGKMLYATAKKISGGRSTCHYEVFVKNDEEKLISHVVIDGFILGAWE